MREETREERLEHAIYDALKFLPVRGDTETTAAILRGQLPERLQTAAERWRPLPRGLPRG